MRSRSAGSPPAQSNRRSPVEVSPALLDGPTLADLRQAVKSPYAPDGPSLPHLAFMWIIDLALWIVVMLRDYDLGMYQCTITHFIAVLPMSDMAALFFPRDLMHWVDLFRFTGGLQMLALTGQLMLNGIDGASLWWSLFRIALAGLRCAHAVVGLYSHFDWGTNGRLIATPKALKKIIVTQLFRVHLRRLYAYVVALPGPQGQFNEFFSAFVFAAFAAFVRSTHNTFQQPLAEGPLTSFQAADALNFFIKNFFYERLLSATPNPTKQTGMLKRSVWYFFMGTVLALQWPFFFDMFAKAPIPFAHAAAEFSLFALAYARWKSSRVRS